MDNCLAIPIKTNDLMFCKALLLFFLILNLHNNSFAQCFASPGNPIAGSTNLGILDKNKIRTIGFYQYSLSNQYYEGSKPSDYNPAGAISSAFYHYSGFNIGYGLAQRLSLEADVGYYLSKTQHYKYLDYELKGQGLSNLLISAKYNVFQDFDRNAEITLSAGPKIPFSTSPQIVDGVELPVDVQPSTGNFGAVFQAFFVKEFILTSARLIFIARYENNFSENQQGYRFGDAYVSSLFISKHLANRWTDLTKNLTLIMQARHEYRGSNQRYGKTVDYSGSNLLFFAPQINFNLNLIWNFSLIYDIPVYQYYSGIQLAKSHAITFSIARDIGFKL